MANANIRRAGGVSPLMLSHVGTRQSANAEVGRACDEIRLGVPAHRRLIRPVLRGCPGASFASLRPAPATLPLIAGLLLTLFFSTAASTARAQAPTQTPPPAAPKEDLSQSQLQLLRDFERFEKSLYDVAEFSRRTDPEQSELLYRARSQSQEQRILDEMRLLADSLKPQTGGKVVIGDSPEKQDEVIARLQVLLKVLQSADERDRIQREIERIQDLLKGTNALIGKQRDVRSDTGRGGDQKQLSEREQKIIEEAEKLAKKIDKQDAERSGESPDSKSPDGKPSDPKDPKDPGQQKPGDQKSPDGKPSEPSPGSEPKPGEPKPGEKGSESKDGSPMKGSEKDPPKGEQKDPSKSPDDKKPMPGEKSPDGKEPMEPKDTPPMDGKSPSKPGEPQESQPGQKSPPQDQPPQDGQPQKGKPQKGQPPQELGQPKKPQGPQSPQEAGEEPQDDKKTSGREELEEARKQMQRALEELDKQNREGSTEAQQQALAQLEKVKARLEAILRQLREEENELLLASLESRFQKLRKAQMQVNAETIRLEKSAAEDRSRHTDRAVALSRDEREIAIDAEKALSLLKEEGSSVAFPEAIEQMRDNMLTVADRLNRGDTASTTQVVEDLIVETLDEMILAMQQEMEKAKDKDKDKQQQQKKQQQDDEQNALINELAELKMIRSLQNQINRLTRQVGRELEGEQAKDPDLIKMTEELSRRQKRLQQATYDLATGKNK
jgi:hypothetical protein